MCKLENHGSESVRSGNRLPKTVVPSRYDLTLRPNLVKFDFTGEEVVDIDVLEPTSTIQVNAKELNISEAKVVDANGTTLNGTIELCEETEVATITFDGVIGAGKWSFITKFTGILNDQLKGFYRSFWEDEAGKKHTIATTQFEATDARRAFPCWDEPDFKAVFAVTLVVEADLIAVSNGREIAREFLRGHHPLVVVDSSRASLADAREAGHMVIEGDATEEEVLLRANVAHAKGLVAALPRDSDNVYITLTAREYNRELHIAARSLDPGSEHRLLKAGANRVVNPYVIGGKRLAAVMLHPEIMDFLDLSMQQDPEGFSLRHLTVGSGSKLKDRTLAELDLRRIGRGVMVLGISRPTGAERSMVIPTADTALAQDDTLILLGNQSMYQALEAEGIVSR